MSNEATRDKLLEGLEYERAALFALLPRFSDAQWSNAARADGWTVRDIVAHLADSHYGLALMALGEIEPALPLNPETNWMDVDDYNDQRRVANATLPREKVTSRLVSAFGHAQRAIANTADFGEPGPYGPAHTKKRWLGTIVGHSRIHREELEALLDA